MSKRNKIITQENFISFMSSDESGTYMGVIYVK